MGRVFELQFEWVFGLAEAVVISRMGRRLSLGSVWRC